MSTFKDRLEKMGPAWETGKDKLPGVPDGIYTMKLQKCELAEAQSSGNLMVKREHVVVDGEFTGTVTKDNLMLEGTENGPYYVSKFIELMGYEAPNDPKEIEETLLAIQTDAPCYIAEVKVNGEYRNVRIKELVETGDSQAVETPTPAAAPKPAPAKKGASKALPVAKKAVSDGVAEGTEVTFINEDVEMTGTIKRTAAEEGSPDQYIVESGEDLFQLERSDFTIADQNQDAVEAAAAGEDASELKAFAGAHGLEGITDDSTYDEAKEIITSYEYKKEELTTEEVTLLEGLGATIKVPAAKPKPTPKPLPAPAAKPVATVKKVVQAVPKPVPAKVPAASGPTKIVKKK